MSAVLKVAVADGVVMATDSRVTVQDGPARRTFDGFRKLFTFRPDVPVALMTWGTNRIEQHSIGDIVARATEKLQSDLPEWKLEPETTTLPQLAERVTNFVFHDYYQPAVEKGVKLSDMMLHFAGFSPGESQPEHVEYRLAPEHIHGPHADTGQSVQVNFHAPYIPRIMTGAAPELMGVLTKEGMEEATCRKTLNEFGSQQLKRLLSAGMPLRELAALVRCLMDTEINLVRYGFDPDVVGGDLQMVIIDRHGCREMQFRPTNFQIPNTVWEHGNVRKSR